MKSVVFCNIYDDLNTDNLMFEHRNVGIGDDLLLPLHELKRYANQIGINVCTVSVLDIDQADAVVFIDTPDEDNKYFKKALNLNKIMYLVIFESKLVFEQNYDLNKHRYFKKIFTYDDSLIDNIKYFKISYSFKLPQEIKRDLTKKEKLCALIAGNKRSNSPLELYSKRIEAIRWFERHHPAEFDLYGIGWDEYSFFGIKTNRKLNKIFSFRKFFTHQFPSYKGIVERKKPILEKYKFAICYENIRDIPGYITEKIFDCFFAGCVPIYLGANNIAFHVPRDCFIDKRDFDTYDKLYDFLHNMNDKVYLEYLENIQRYLNSEKSYEFSVEYFAKTIVDEIALFRP